MLCVSYNGKSGKEGRSMKGSKRYFVILGVFMVLAFVFQYYSPKPFRWTPTFYHNDRQPFGCYVFNKVIRTSVCARAPKNRSRSLARRRSDTRRGSCDRAGCRNYFGAPRCRLNLHSAGTQACLVPNLRAHTRRIIFLGQNFKR